MGVSRGKIESNIEKVDDLDECVANVITTIDPLFERLDRTIADLCSAVDTDFGSEAAFSTFATANAHFACGLFENVVKQHVWITGTRAEDALDALWPQIRETILINIAASEAEGETLQ